MTKPFVVGVDGSEGGAQALRWARREGQLRGTPVTAVLAWGWFDQRYPDLQRRYESEYTDETARDALRAFVGDAIDPGDVDEIGLQPVCELPSTALLEAGADASMLVVGGRGLGGFKGLLLGAVSYQCLHHSRTPVAIVRQPSPALAEGHPERIVVGVDGSAASVRALRWAADEARLRQASLEVVHAWQVALATGAMYGGAMVDDPRISTVAALGTLDAALAQVDLAGLEDRVRRSIPCAAPAAALLELAAGASLIVVGTRGHGGFAGLLLGSTTTQVVHHAACPVVVFPPEGSSRW